MYLILICLIQNQFIHMKFVLKDCIMIHEYTGSNLIIFSMNSCRMQMKTLDFTYSPLPLAERILSIIKRCPNAGTVPHLYTSDSFV